MKFAALCRLSGMTLEFTPAPLLDDVVEPFETPRDLLGKRSVKRPDVSGPDPAAVRTLSRRPDESRAVSPSKN
jgi:hypothetical protein